MTTTKLFLKDGDQCLRLPGEFRFAGDRIRVRRVGRALLLEPLITDVSEWFAELDRARSVTTELFMPTGRRQPRPARRRAFR